MGFFGDVWSGIQSTVGGAANTAKNVVEHPLDTLHKGIRDVTDTLGVTSGPPPDISQTPAAQALTDFSKRLQDEYANRQPGTNDTSQADQARGIQQGTINDLQGVASGKTNTAADALLTKGTDEASRRALGTAAQYSAYNPGDALRKGLAAGTDAGSKATADAAIMKAQEQESARAQLAAAANAMRGGDISQQGVGLNQQQINNARDAALRSATQTSLGAAFVPTEINSTNVANNNAANQSAMGNLWGTGARIYAGGMPSGGGSSGGGGVTPYPGGQGGDGLADPTYSDARLKTDIRDGSRDADAFLASLRPRDYEWRDPRDPRSTGPGEKLGVVAQEMRPQDTREDAAGAKFIPPDIVSKLLAGMGRLHERVVAVEGKGDKPVEWGPNPYPKAPPEKPIVMPERRKV